MAKADFDDEVHRAVNIPDGLIVSTTKGPKKENGLPCSLCDFHYIFTIFADDLIVSATNVS